MCNLRFPFEAQSYQGLAVKIMKGSYPSITPTYTKQLRDLITSMLSPAPINRPTIVDVINKPFIKKRI
jgi:serine/threonine protein kinase